MVCASRFPFQGARVKARHTISGDELAAVLAGIDAKLSNGLIDTQPEVASRIAMLAELGDASLTKFADAIKVDPGLCGRLLKLANSAYFSRGAAVTALDRACVLLGEQRVRAMALGFYISRAGADRQDEPLCREVWGQSVYRACLAASIASASVPTLTSEAFVVGLLLDVGIPLMPSLLGDRYRRLIARGVQPGVLFQVEFEQLPFTHVDVASVLMGKWKLPALLAEPVARHHEPVDASAGPQGPGEWLRRIAHFTGELSLRADTPGAADDDGAARTAEALLGIPPRRFLDALSQSGAEYDAMMQLFCDVADKSVNIDELLRRVRAQLASALDAALGDFSFLAERAADGVFTFGRQTVEISVQPDGSVWAYLRGSHGERLAGHCFDPGEASFDNVMSVLAIEERDGVDARRMDAMLRDAA